MLVPAGFVSALALAGSPGWKGSSEWCVSAPHKTDVFFHVGPCGSQALELVVYLWGQMLSWV